jgi:hypothetical protein
MLAEAVVDQAPLKRPLELAGLVVVVPDQVVHLPQLREPLIWVAAAGVVATKRPLVQMEPTAVQA